MARRRFFVDAIREGLAELRGEDARHLARVLRAEAGQIYEISDNHAAYLAEIVEAHGERIVFRVLDPLPAPAAPVHVTLVAALIKFDRFEWMIEKATELGVERILPVVAARTEKGLLAAARTRAKRWARIAREASQQSRRVHMPEILPAARLEASLSIANDYRYFLEETEAAPLIAMLPPYRASSAQVALLIGPEGGWTDAERALAAGARWQAVSLGPTVLRAETAAIAALAVLANAWLL